MTHENETPIALLVRAIALLAEARECVADADDAVAGAIERIIDGNPAAAEEARAALVEGGWLEPGDPPPQPAAPALSLSGVQVSIDDDGDILIEKLPRGGSGGSGSSKG